jgi:hypothetical protein
MHQQPAKLRKCVQRIQKAPPSRSRFVEIQPQIGLSKDKQQAVFS